MEEVNGLARAVRILCGCLQSCERTVCEYSLITPDETVMRKILCVQDRGPVVDKELSGLLRKFEVDACHCSDPWDSLRIGRGGFFHMAIIDLEKSRNPGKPDGPELFYLFKNCQVYIPLTILITGEAVEQLEHLIYEGVTQIIQRPVAIPLVVSLAMEILDYDELAHGGSLIA